MTTRLTARSIQYAPAPRPRGSRPANPRHAFRIIARVGQAVWLGCDYLESSQIPAGHTFIDARLAKGGLPDITITPGLTSGQATISGGVYKFLDDKEELGAWLADKAINGVQVFSSIIEHYKLDELDDLNDPQTMQRCLAYTFQIRKTIKSDKAVYEFSCEDIQRDLETEIFNKPPFKLYATIGETDSVIAITLPTDEAADHDYAFLHGRDYLVNPNDTRAYLLIDDEYISYRGLRTDQSIDGVSVTSLEAPIRGEFGTAPAAHEVSADTPVENRPEMVHVAYCEETDASLALAILTNRFLDGRTWTHGLDTSARWVNFRSFADAGSTRRRTVRRHKSESAKRYLEEQVLSKMPAILIPNPVGELQLQEVSFYRAPTATDVIDESSCYGGSLSALTHDASDCKEWISLAWDLDPLTETYRQTTALYDTYSAAETQATEPAEYEADTITTSRSTESEVRQILGVLWAKHALPVKRLSAALMPELHHLLPGDAVQVRHTVRDYKTATGYQQTIDTPMLVGTIRDRQKEGRYTVDLIGYQAPPAQLLTGGLPMPESVYMENGTLLPGVVGGVATGSPAIALNRKYYYLGDLTLPADWNPTFVGTGDFELWVRGVLLWAYPLDGQGRGMSGGVRGYTQAPPPAGPWTANVDRSVNSAGEAQGIIYSRVRSHPPSVTGRAPGDLAERVTVERGRIVGLPPVLAGSGGAAGETCTWNETRDGGIQHATGSIPGTGGAAGGMGGKIVCFPGSGFVASGGVDCSGANGTATTTSTIGGHAAAGAGGAHGHWAFYTDGIGTQWQGITSTRFVAKHGLATLGGTKTPAATYEKRNGPYFGWRGFYDPPQDDTNRWTDAHTIGVIPPSQTAVDTTYSAFNEYFIDQPDGRSRVYVQAARPSDGNKWDLWITPEQLASGSTTPILYVFTATGYTLVDWVNTQYATVYHALLAIARRGGNTLHYGPARPSIYTDGDEWIDSSTGLRWILYTGREDVLTGGGNYLWGANKWPNGNLASYPEEQTIYVFDNLDLVPSLPRGVVGTAPTTGVFGVPASLTGTATASAVTISWTAVSGALKYNIDRATGTGPFSYLTTVSVGTEHTDNTVSTGITYKYRVNAIRGSAGQEEYSDWSAVLEITAETDGTGTPGTPVSVATPTGITATVISSTEILINWANQSDVDGFRVLRNSVLISTVTIVDDVLESEYLDTTAVAQTTYVYEVRAYVGSNESAGATVTVTSSQAPASGDLLPNAPTGLSVSIYSGTSAELFWTPVPIADRAGGINYEIEQDTVRIRVTEDANVSSHFMSNLDPATEYDWRIRLSDGGGGFSAWVAVTGTTNP